MAWVTVPWREEEEMLSKDATGECVKLRRRKHEVAVRSEGHQ